MVPTRDTTDGMTAEYRPKVTKDTYIRQHVSKAVSEGAPKTATLDVNQLAKDEMSEVDSEWSTTSDKWTIPEEAVDRCSASADDLRAYAYEGSGSGVGSLSSLGSELNETDYDIVELARGLGKLAFIYQHQSESD